MLDTLEDLFYSSQSLILFIIEYLLLGGVLYFVHLFLTSLWYWNLCWFFIHKTMKKTNLTEIVFFFIAHFTKRNIYIYIGCYISEILGFCPGALHALDPRAVFTRWIKICCGNTLEIRGRFLQGVCRRFA